MNARLDMVSSFLGDDDRSRFEAVRQDRSTRMKGQRSVAVAETKSATPAVSTTSKMPAFIDTHYVEAEQPLLPDAQDWIAFLIVPVVVVAGVVLALCLAGGPVQ